VKIWAIAANTYRKSVRNKTLIFMFLLSLFIIMFAPAFSFLDLVHATKVVKDVGLAATSLFGMLIGLFLASTEIAGEVRDRTAHNVLAKPVTRLEFILGKFLGVLLVVLTAAGLMALFMCVAVVLAFRSGYTEDGGEIGLLRAASLAVANGDLSVALVRAIGLALVELAFVTGVASAFSALTGSHIISLAATALVYLLGHMNPGLRTIAAQADSAPLRLFMTGLLRVVPNLARFNLRDEAVLNQMVLPWSKFWMSLGYGLLFTAFALVVGYLFFRRKEI